MFGVLVLHHPTPPIPRRSFRSLDAAAAAADGVETVEDEEGGAAKIQSPAVIGSVAPARNSPNVP